jgi:hypothetical protein
MRSDCADKSRAKLTRLPLIRRVGQYGDQHPNLRGSCFWGRPKFWPQPCPPKGQVDSLWVSPLGLAFSYLCQPPFLNVSILVQGFGHARSTPWELSLPEDEVRREACRVYSEWLWAQR